ncbi:hypothetical protein CEXT_276141 [Caerostris extrusa]|uniref:Uncharacterized protein n=1 Tax=Caerostris extrusa TaxID=172846 RepID=A0AAV4WT20_CAEEX|nr:hypothetical protein CEXT_276141 [Caerostris extrusa]
MHLLAIIKLNAGRDFIIMTHTGRAQCHRSLSKTLMNGRESVLKWPPPSKREITGGLLHSSASFEEDRNITRLLAFEFLSRLYELSIHGKALHLPHQGSSSASRAKN